MAAAILSICPDDTMVALQGGGSGVLDVTVDDKVIYSKTELGVSKDEVNELIIADQVNDIWADKNEIS